MLWQSRTPYSYHAGPGDVESLISFKLKAQVRRKASLVVVSLDGCEWMVSLDNLRHLERVTDGWARRRPGTSEQAVIG